MTATPRIAPIPPRQWPATMRSALEPIRPPDPDHPSQRPGTDRPKALNLLGTLAHHPALTAAYHAFVRHVLYESSLTARQRELVILRVASRRGADYEWAQHVVLGADAGITPEEIGRLTDAVVAPTWSPLEAAMLRAADELVSDARIADDTWSALAAELDERQLMDLVFTVGAYEMLAMALNSFSVALDDDLAPHAPARRDVGR